MFYLLIPFQFPVPDRPNLVPKVASTPHAATPDRPGPILKVASTISILVGLGPKEVPNVSLTQIP